MRATLGPIAATTAKKEQSPFSGGYSGVHGDVLGVGMICKRGAELMPSIAAKGVGSGQLVRGEVTK